MNPEDDRGYDEPQHKTKTEWDEWTEEDDARRYGEWKSDQQSFC